MICDDVSLRERTLCIYTVIGNTHVGNYIPAETGCLWFIETGLIYPFDCTVIPGGPGTLLPPMSKNVSFIGVKIGKVADGAFPSWKCWYRFFYTGKEVFNDGISTVC